MFDGAYVNDVIGLNTPHNPYAPGQGDLFESAPVEGRFRLQRLGVYLLSDLFTSGFMKPSQFVRDKELITLARDKRMTFTGETYDQWDLDVLLHCVARTTVLDERAVKTRIEPGVLLRAMNLRNNDINRERVFSSLMRLSTGSLMIEGKGYRYMTRFIDRVLLDETKNDCLVEVNTDVVTSLKQERNLALDIENRTSFRRNGLAKWLHGAVMSFKGGFAANINCLHTLCGAPSRTRHAFPARLGKALDDMVKCGAIVRWQMKDDTVKVMPACVRNTGSACGYISPSLF